jgi:hypothetical protein
VRACSACHQHGHLGLPRGHRCAHLEAPAAWMPRCSPIPPPGPAPRALPDWKEPLRGRQRTTHRTKGSSRGPLQPAGPPTPPGPLTSRRPGAGAEAAAAQRALSARPHASRCRPGERAPGPRAHGWRLAAPRKGVALPKTQGRAREARAAGPGLSHPAMVGREPHCHSTQSAQGTDSHHPHLRGRAQRTGRPYQGAGLAFGVWDYRCVVSLREECLGDVPVPRVVKEIQGLGGRGSNCSSCR